MSQAKNQRHKLPGEFLKAASKTLGANSFSTDISDCWPYGYDYSQRHHCPSAISFPQNNDEVIELVNLCKQHGISIVGRGGATNATGAVVPSDPSLVISFERMRGILEANYKDRYIQTQVGALNSDIQKEAGKHGFFWGPCPTSSEYSTIGGNIACNASGARALKYGSCRENVLGLTAVTGEGKLIRTGVKTTKTSVGYDLTRLLIGSEGTLALILEATLKLTPLPDTIYTFAITYKTIEESTEAVAKIMSQPVVPCSLEFMDSGCLKILSKVNPSLVPSEARAMLIVEIDPNKNEIESAKDRIISSAGTPLEINHASTNTDREAIWNLRKSLPASLRQLAPKKLNEDIVVPISNIPKFIQRTEKISEEHNIPIVNFGHAGNGNLHANILYNPDSESESKVVREVLSEIFDTVISLDGSISGEHGIGLEKKPFIDREVDANSLDLMKSIKNCFDPYNILNPGKIL
jgi:D-lactate dehydrogenase